MLPLYRIYAIRDESEVLPKGTWKRFEDVPFLAGREKECLAEVLGRLARFGQAFDPDRWDSVSVNPFIDGNHVAYWGVYGETIVVEGQYYVNDVVDGDNCCVSPTDEPFWCLHRGAFETNDHELYRRLVAMEAGHTDDAAAALNPAAVALYIIRKSGPGELTLEANRETGQRLIIGLGCKTATYEYWNVGDPEPASVTRFGSIDAAAAFLVKHGFIRLEPDGRPTGALAERLLDWLAKEKPPATIKDVKRLNARRGR
jgi:hypothetical protein